MSRLRPHNYTLIQPFSTVSEIQKRADSLLFYVNVGSEIIITRSLASAIATFVSHGGLMPSFDDLTDEFKQNHQAYYDHNHHHRQTNTDSVGAVAHPEHAPIDTCERNKHARGGSGTHWLPHEDASLLKEIYLQIKTFGKVVNWDSVLNAVRAVTGRRTLKQIHRRWSYLNPARQSTNLHQRMRHNENARVRRRLDKELQAAIAFENAGTCHEKLFSWEENIVNADVANGAVVNDDNRDGTHYDTHYDDDASLDMALFDDLFQADDTKLLFGHGVGSETNGCCDGGPTDCFGEVLKKTETDTAVPKAKVDAVAEFLMTDEVLEDKCTGAVDSAAANGGDAHDIHDNDDAHNMTPSSITKRGGVTSGALITAAPILKLTFGSWTAPESTMATNMMAASATTNDTNGSEKNTQDETEHENAYENDNDTALLNLQQQQKPNTRNATEDDYYGYPFCTRVVNTNARDGCMRMIKGAAVPFKTKPLPFHFKARKRERWSRQTVKGMMNCIAQYQYHHHTKNTIANTIANTATTNDKKTAPRNAKRKLKSSTATATPAAHGAAAVGDCDRDDDNDDDDASSTTSNTTTITPMCGGGAGGSGGSGGGGHSKRRRASSRLSVKDVECLRSMIRSIAKAL
jgi:hypothetical protein